MGDRTFSKRCHCGRQFHSISEWQSCQLVGVQSSKTGQRFELRNCNDCHTTLAVEVPCD